MIYPNVVLLILTCLCVFESESSESNKNLIEDAKVSDNVTDYKDSNKLSKTIYYLCNTEGEHGDVIDFWSWTDNIYYSDKKLIARDAIRDGNNINDPNSYSRKTYWTGTTWHTIAENEQGPFNIDIKPFLIYSGEPAYFNVRHGRVRDLLYVYAIVSGKVYRSKEWSDSGPGETLLGVAVSPIANPVTVKGYPFSEDKTKGFPTNESSYGVISFDPNTLKFSYKVGNGAT